MPRFSEAAALHCEKRGLGTLRRYSGPMRRSGSQSVISGI